MCKFCEKPKTTKIDESCETSISLKDAEWEDYAPFNCNLNVDTKEMEFSYDAYSCDSSFYTALKINFCPFCGRKL